MCVYMCVRKRESVCVCVCVSGGGSSKPIRELAVQLHRNKGTFIIQLGSCRAAQRKKTSNLVLLGEDAQKSGRRKTGTNKRRTKLITRVHCTQTKSEECFKAAGRPVICRNMETSVAKLFQMIGARRRAPDLRETGAMQCCMRTQHTFRPRDLTHRSSTHPSLWCRTSSTPSDAQKICFSVFIHFKWFFIIYTLNRVYTNPLLHHGFLF